MGTTSTAQIYQSAKYYKVLAFSNGFFIVILFLSAYFALSLESNILADSILTLVGFSVLFMGYFFGFYRLSQKLKIKNIKEIVGFGTLSYLTFLITSLMVIRLELQLYGTPPITDTGDLWRQYDRLMVVRFIAISILFLESALGLLLMHRKSNLSEIPRYKSVFVSIYGYFAIGLLYIFPVLQQINGGSVQGILNVFLILFVFLVVIVPIVSFIVLLRYALVLNRAKVYETINPNTSGGSFAEGFD